MKEANYRIRVYGFNEKKEPLGKGEAVEDWEGLQYILKNQSRVFCDAINPFPPYMCLTLVTKE